METFLMEPCRACKTSGRVLAFHAFPIAISVIFPLWWQTLPHFPVKIPLKWENCSEKVRLEANS